jgi:hypothetical protein
MPKVLSSLMVIFGLLCAAALPAQAGLDMSAVTKDVQQVRTGDHRITIVMWLPEQFWRAAITNSGKITDDQAEQFLKTVRPYTLVAVVDAKVGTFAGLTFADRSTLAAGVTIEDANHNTYNPLGDDDVSPDLSNLLHMMAPVLTNMMGATGAHFEFFVFPADAKGGGRVVDAEHDGSFAVHVLDLTFKYRLPLGSLLAPQIDPKTGESFPGNFHFNPFTGDKLAPQPAASPPAAGKT